MDPEAGSDEFIQSDPEATLERAFIAEFLQRHGHTISTIHELPEVEATALMKEASIYASARLSEVDARSHYVHDIHDASKGST
jgi:hypothetical protein